MRALFAGELRRVSVPVDPTLEISEVVTRTVRAGGPALLFERPTRGEMPVAINLSARSLDNPELLAVTPLSATQIQISAKKAGVTQVNLWDEEGNIHTVDVMIYGDARELSAALQTQFPHSTIRVYRYSESLVLTGKTQAAEKMIHMISSFYRRSLADDPTSDVPLPGRDLRASARISF